MRQPHQKGDCRMTLTEPHKILEQHLKEKVLYFEKSGVLEGFRLSALTNSYWRNIGVSSPHRRDRNNFQN